MRVRLIVPVLTLGLVSAVAAAAQQSAITAQVAIGKSIEANMPVDTASTFDAGVGNLVCWTRITGATAGSKVTHVWMHGSDSLKVELNVGGSPWRTFSRKTIPAGASGDWKVEVRDASGAVLATKAFKIG